MNSSSNRCDEIMIRSLQLDDRIGVERVQAECYPLEALESGDSLMSHWRVSPTTCLVAASGDEIIGYLLAHPWPRRMIPPLNKVYEVLPENADSLFLHDLALSPPVRGTGLARKLVERVLDTGERLGMTHASLISVQGSERFWNRFGFVAIDPPSAEYAAAVRVFYPSSEFRVMELDFVVNQKTKPFPG